MNEREIMSLAVTFGVGILILSQVTVVDANPFRVGSSGILIFSPTSSVYLTPNVDICFVCNMRNNLTRVNSFSFSLDKGANSTMAFKVSESDIYVKGIKYSVSRLWRT
jgi:hypothetical protein